MRLVMRYHCDVPNKKEFRRGVKAFERREKREAMYKVARFLVDYNWGKPADMADGLGVLLLTWNQAFYRYGTFDYNKLEQVIRTNIKLLDKYRNRDIFSFSEADVRDIKKLFNELLDALKIATGSMKGRRSPVAVSKALHLLAPGYFSLWDDKIAKAYGCYYSKKPADKYIDFCVWTKSIAQNVNGYVKSKKTLCKLIDEYNYSKYTKRNKGWI